VQTHTDERVPLDDRLPSQERFSALLADSRDGRQDRMDSKLLISCASSLSQAPRRRISS